MKLAVLRGRLAACVSGLMNSLVVRPTKSPRNGTFFITIEKVIKHVYDNYYYLKTKGAHKIQFFNITINTKVYKKAGKAANKHSVPMIESINYLEQMYSVYMLHLSK